MSVSEMMDFVDENTKKLKAQGYRPDIAILPMDLVEELMRRLKERKDQKDD
jgi:hypothetical protein